MENYDALIENSAVKPTEREEKNLYRRKRSNARAKKNTKADKKSAWKIVDGITDRNRILEFIALLLPYDRTLVNNAAKASGQAMCDFFNEHFELA